MLTGLLVFLTLLVVLLAIPLTLTFRVSFKNTLKSGDIKVGWLFGLLRVNVPTKKILSPTQPQAGFKPKKLKKTSKKKKHLSDFMETKFLFRAISFIQDMWRAIHKEDINARIRIGLGDPADTGQLWAVVGPTAGLLHSVPNVTIHIEPEFYKTTFEADGSGKIRIIPVYIIYLLAGFLLSPSVWRAIK